MLHTATAASSGGSISALVVLVVLGAAILHATWNAIAHGISDRLVGFTLINLTLVGVGALLILMTGLPSPAAWPYIIASAGVHAIYQLTLMAGYQLGQFSQVYPLARGTSPWLVAVLSVTVLGQQLAPPELLGVLVISAGLISLVFLGGRPTRAQLPALAAAVGTGTMIATYTTIDAVGVGTTDVLSYVAWLFFLQGLVMPPLALVKRRGPLLAQLRPSLLTGIGGGVVSVIAYGLVLWALTQGVAAPIAALRETSIIFGAVIGSLVFHERLGRGRTLAAAVVVVGVVLISV